VKDRLEAIPSVYMAAVERRLPGNLHLAIVERQPVAIWQNNGEHLLVDRLGRTIPGSIAGFEDLPLVVGDGAGGHADELLSMLGTEPELASRVKAAVRVANRRWNLMLDDAQKGVEVRLPEDQPEAAWRRLAQLERERALSARQVSMIDLRTPDRMVLKTERPASPAEAAKRKDNGA
jgi:cell division protein FtsQ